MSDRRSISRILLMEDEPGLARVLTRRLQEEGYAVEPVTDDESGLALATCGGFDLLLLDSMLPRWNALDVCRTLRRGGLEKPILMLTPRGCVEEKVAGLRGGADDCLTKPFHLIELMARIEALLRRSRSEPAGGICQFGDIRVDQRSAQVLRNSTPLILSAKEFQLLSYLIDHAGAIVSREELLREVWGYGSAVSSRTVDVHVAWLRQKLGDQGHLPRWIVTVRGAGYKFTRRSGAGLGFDGRVPGAKPLVNTEG